jgi:hypothetical protein
MAITGRGDPKVRGHFAADRHGQSDDSDTRPILQKRWSIMSARAKSLESGQKISPQWSHEFAPLKKTASPPRLDGTFHHP